MLNSSENGNDNDIAVDIKDVKSPALSLAKKPKRRRTFFPTEHLNKLELYFKENPYPGFKEREGLSCELKIEEFAINTWFKNKRARIIKARNKKLNKKEPVENKNGKSRVTARTAAAASIEETIGIDLEDLESKQNEEEKKVVSDDFNKNPQPHGRHFEDVSMYEFPVFENGRTEVTEAFEPILLKILSAPPN